MGSTSRRHAVITLTVALAVPRRVVGAPADRELRKVGFLGPAASESGFVEAFRQGMREHGWVEGRNVAIAYRVVDIAAAGDGERLRRLAEELVRLAPEVIVASVIEAVLAARRATASIPIVMVNVGDPVGAGLIDSLGHPGGNVTGLSRQGPELIGKQLELLSEALPRARRVGVLISPSEPLRAELARLTIQAAESLRLQPIILEPVAPEGLEAAFARMRAERVDAVVVGGGGPYYLSRALIAELALRDRLPSIHQNRESAEAGGLMSYAASSVANYRRAAFFVDRILHGARPAELPVEQPTKFELLVNLKTANSLGVVIPQSVLLRADAVMR